MNQRFTRALTIVGIVALAACVAHRGGDTTSRSSEPGKLAPKDENEIVAEIKKQLVAQSAAPPPPVAMARDQAYPTSVGFAALREHDPGNGFNIESYTRFDENPFLEPSTAPLSTFSIDVDTASYANVRRFLRDGSLPPKDAVRIEELLNYFAYDDAPPSGGAPFATHVDVASCPWNERHRLVRIALKGEEVSFEDRKPGNYVFLVDVSGSMQDAAKLPFVKEGLKMLASQLRADDRVAIAVYAGAAGLALPSTAGSDREAIVEALDRLEAGGSTAGGAGIRLAYDVATDHFIEGGINRVILATDGDFNVGVSSEGELTRLIEEKAKSGVFLTVLGFGTGNLKDSMLEKLADRGNGSYAYIDSDLEAKRVFVEQAGGTFVTIAKDVKIQVEFNPVRVAAYRLIGYENRRLEAQDFNDDTKDAGEIGAGHSVVALYEVVPVGEPSPAKGVDPLTYATPPTPNDHARTGELLTLKLRYKDPDGDTSRLMTRRVLDASASWAATSPDFKFSAAVAAFGMILRESPHRSDASFDLVRSLASQGLGADSGGWRTEFVSLVDRAAALGGGTAVAWSE